MLEERKIFPEIDDWEGIRYIFFCIFDGKVKPFIVAFSIGIILYEEDVVIMFDETLIG